MKRWLVSVYESAANKVAKTVKALSRMIYGPRKYTLDLLIALPDDLAHEVFSYLTELDQVQFSRANHQCHDKYTFLVKQLPQLYPVKFYVMEQMNQGKSAYKVHQELLHIKRAHPPHFLQAMGGLKQILQIPVMDIGMKMGFTDYLDFNVTFTPPVVRGLDKFNRCFYFARAWVIDDLTNQYTEVTFKIFQRYTCYKSWESSHNKDGLNHISDELLCYTKENRNRHSTAKGVNAVRLGYRGLRFFAQLVTTGEVGRPVTDEDNHISLANYTRIPEKDDDDYEAIYLAI